MRKTTTKHKIAYEHKYAEKAITKNSNKTGIDTSGGDNRNMKTNNETLKTLTGSNMKTRIALIKRSRKLIDNIVLVG